MNSNNEQNFPLFTMSEEGYLAFLSWRKRIPLIISLQSYEGC